MRVGLARSAIGAGSLVILGGTALFFSPLVAPAVDVRENLGYVLVTGVLGFAICVVGLALMLWGIVTLRQAARQGDDGRRCTHCDYPLIGLIEPRCPECGTPFAPDQSGEVPRR